MDEQSFFAKLYNAMEGTSWTINVTASKGTLTMTLAPVLGKSVPPIVMSGTPADFEKEFFAQLEKPIQMIGFQVQGYTELTEAIAKAKEDKSKEVKKTAEAQNKPAGATQTKKTADTPTKEVVSPTVDIFTEELDVHGNAPSDPFNEEPVEEVSEDPEDDSQDDPDEFDETLPEPPEVKEEKKEAPKEEPTIDLFTDI